MGIERGDRLADLPVLTEVSDSWRERYDASEIADRLRLASVQLAEHGEYTLAGNVKDGAECIECLAMELEAQK